MDLNVDVDVEGSEDEGWGHRFPYLYCIRTTYG